MLLDISSRGSGIITPHLRFSRLIILFITSESGFYFIYFDIGFSFDL
jgi:hypothetical protein